MVGARLWPFVAMLLVFLPLFALSGIEGRLFTPRGVAYIVSILASLLTAITELPDGTLVSVLDVEQVLVAAGTEAVKLFPASLADPERLLRAAKVLVSRAPESGSA